ncbi:hypothetical protein [Desulfolithobacter sp.]
MTSFLNVPFLPDPQYASFLADNVAVLDSIHFELPGSHGFDSRVRFDHAALELSLDLLSAIMGPRRYVLLNSRFYAPALFTDSDALRVLVETLDHCASRVGIDGIIYSDHYLLQLLADAAPDLVAILEAVPSVNTMLDSFARIEAQLGYIRETGFRQPAKIILDRSLNRDLDRLAAIGLQRDQQQPQIGLELLANEGCLPFCPYKLSHDAYIAFSNLTGRDCTYHLNRELGCLRLVEQQPHRLLQSPFIRPEDTDLYLYHVESIKICGRTLGPEFLTRTITAYIEHRWEGNLLELLDAMYHLSDRLYVDNGGLSFDFANILSMCAHQCDECGFCEELFETIAKPRSLVLQDWRVAVD